MGTKRAPAGTTVTLAEANGLPALLVQVQGKLFSVLTLDVEGELIRAVHNVANPDKLEHLKLPSTPGRQWSTARAYTSSSTSSSSS